MDGLVPTQEEASEAIALGLSKYPKTKGALTLSSIYFYYKSVKLKSI